MLAITLLIGTLLGLGWQETRRREQLAASEREAALERAVQALIPGTRRILSDTNVIHL